jgi:hypothetical protein
MAPLERRATDFYLGADAKQADGLLCRGLQ